MLDKNQIHVIFLLEFKMGCKAAQRTCSINNAFGPGTANKRPVQWWFGKFCKGDESLEDEERDGRPSEVDSDQLRGSSELTLLKLHEKLPKNPALTILQSFGIWSTLRRWQSSVHMSWQQILKTVILKCRLLSRYTTTNHFSNGLWDEIKSGISMTICDDQLSGWIKKLQTTSQSQTCTKKGPGHCLVVCCLLVHYSFLNPSETISSEKHAQQIDERHWKLQGLQPALVNRKGPVLLHDNA